MKKLIAGRERKKRCSYWRRWTEDWCLCSAGLFCAATWESAAAEQIQLGRAQPAPSAKVPAQSASSAASHSSSSAATNPAAAATLTRTIRLFTAQTLTLCAQSCGTHTNLSLFIFHHLQRWSFVNTTPGSAQTKRLVFGWRRRLLEDTVGARLKIGECEDVCLVPKSWQREVWRRSVKKMKWIWLIIHVDAAVGEVISCSISFKVTPTCENTHVLLEGRENLFWQPSRFYKFT